MISFESIDSAARNKIEQRHDFNLLLTLIVFLVVIAPLIIIPFLFLSGNFLFFQLSSGWLVQAFIALIVLQRKALGYLSHLAIILFTGVLIVCGGVMIGFLLGMVGALLTGVSTIIVAHAYMVHMHIVRVQHLKLSPVWTASWLICIVTSALFWANRVDLFN